MADYKIKYPLALQTITITLTSLATSATRVVGRQSTVIDNSTNLLVDAIVSGKIRVGTTPTVNKQIDIWVFTRRNDTPTYPDTLGATDAAVTLTSENVRNSALKLATSIRVDATTDRDYDFQFSIASLFGGSMPKFWGIFVAHDTVAALNATGSSHEMSYLGIHGQSV